MHHSCVRKRHEVVSGDCSGHFIALDGGHAKFEGGQGHRITADAAAEIGNAVEPRCREAPRVHGRHSQSAGLLEARRRKEHASREGAKFCFGFAAQAVLVEHSRDAARRVPLLAQSRHQCQSIAELSARLKLIEQPQRLGRQQLTKLTRIHDPILPPVRSRTRPPTLALGLREC